MNRKDIVAAFLDRVWSRGDVSSVDTFIADRYHIRNDPGDPWHGQVLDREGFRERLVKSRAMAPDQVFTIVEMVEEGDRVAVAWTWVGTHLGDLPEIHATGKHITMTGLTLYSFDGDRLSGHWQVADRLGVWQQLTGETQG